LNYFSCQDWADARAPDKQDWLEIHAKSIGFLGSLGVLNLHRNLLRPGHPDRDHEKMAD